MIGNEYNVRLKTTHRKGASLSAREQTRLSDMLNGMRGENGIAVACESGGIVVRSPMGGGRTIPWKLTVQNAASTVTVAAGDVIETTVPPYTCPAAVVTVTGGSSASPHYVVLQHVRGVGATILPVASEVKPVSEPGIFRCALFDVGKVRGRIIVYLQRRCGDIDVPGYV